MKRHNDNFYSHKCRLGVCPGHFFLLFSLVPFTQTPTNADQTVLRQERITFKCLVKKGGKKKTLAFSFKMKEICKPLRMWPQGEIRGPEEQSRDDGREPRQRWRFQPRYKILRCSFCAKREMRVKSRQCRECKLIRAFTGWGRVLTAVGQGRLHKARTKKDIVQLNPKNTLQKMSHTPFAFGPHTSLSLSFVFIVIKLNPLDEEPRGNHGDTYRVPWSNPLFYCL